MGYTTEILLPGQWVSVKDKDGGRISSTNPFPVTLYGPTGAAIYFAEDSAHTTGDLGIMALAVQKATPADVSTDGDYAPLQVSAGRLWVRDDMPGLTMAHTQPTSSTVSATALASNANRKYALLINDSAVIAYLFLGATAVANQGIRLNANGGSYEISAKAGNLYTGNIAVISASGSGNVVVVTEGV